jgi:hypothetical protein
VVVSPAPALSAGSSANNNQWANIGKIPPLLTAPEATGGICGGSYSYQWLSSSNNTNFLPVPGATSKDYQPGPLTTTTYFKRQVSCPASVVPVTTNTITVTVYPALSVPSLNPATQWINLNTSASPISVGPLRGGSGNFSYQWQSSHDGSFAAPAAISGATSSSYTPGILSSTTYFRVGVISNGDTSYSSPMVVGIFPSLNAGTILPAAQNVLYDSVPTLLKCASITGGNGTFKYQWYSSADSSNWTLLTGVKTPDYNPGGLESTTWFRVQVTSNGLPAPSTAAVVFVNPKNQ